MGGLYCSSSRVDKFWLCMVAKDSLPSASEERRKRIKKNVGCIIYAA